jgi:MFS family permease
MVKDSVIRKYYDLPRPVYILFLARIINYTGNFIFPFLTLLLVTRLGYEENIAGIYVTIVSVTGGPGMLIGGKLADKYGRRTVILYCAIAIMAGFIICTILGSSPAVPFLLIPINIFISAQNPAIQAMLIDITNRETRKNGFSLLYLGTNIGNSLGPLMVGFLFLNFTRLIFGISAFIHLIIIVFAILWIKETLPSHEKINDEHIDHNEKPEEGNVLTIFFRKTALLAFSIISLIFSFIYAQTTFALPLYLENIFGETGTKLFGTLMTINMVLMIVITLFLIPLMRKIKPILNVFISGIIYAVGFGIIYYFTGFYLFIISTIIWTLGQIINVVYTNVYIADHSPITHRGRFSAMVPFIYMGGFALGPMLMGIFIKYRGIENAWVLIFFSALVGSFLILALYFFKKFLENRLQKVDQL